MKKILSMVLSLMLIGSSISFFPLSSSAFFGAGTQVVASGVNLIKTGLVGQKITFNDTDVKSALAITDFDSITITEIPSSTEGTLLIGGRRVSKGRLIKRKNIRI